MIEFQEGVDSQEAKEEQFSTVTQPLTSEPASTTETSNGIPFGEDDPNVAFKPGTKLRDIERIVILQTLKHKNFNRTHTAKALGIGIRTLQRKLKRYGASDWGLSKSQTA